MNKTVTLFWAVAAGARCLAMDTAAPNELGLSEHGLVEIDTYLQSEVDAGNIAGAVAVVARYGSIAHSSAIGYSDKEKRVLMKEDSIFRIASMTKLITAVSVMTLVEEGSVSLDEKVSKYLPEFSKMTVLKDAASSSLGSIEAEGEITLRQLMTHTSGVAYGWFGPEALDRRYAESGVSQLFTPTDERMRERLERLATIPLKNQPGSAWEYGLSSDILGVVVEEVSGLTLEQFFQERILGPLRMSDSGFYIGEESRDRLAGLYTLDGDNKLQRVGSESVRRLFLTFSDDYCIAGERRFFSGGGGMISTASDYTRFLQMMLNKGELEGARIISEASAQEITKNQIGELTVPFEGHGDGYGYGVGVLTERGKAKDLASVGSYSWGGIFNTYYWVDPEEEMIGVLMTQVFPFFHLSLRDEFKRLCYDAIEVQASADGYLEKRSQDTPSANALGVSSGVSGGYRSSILSARIAD